MPDGQVDIPRRKKDISLLIKHVYNKILGFFVGGRPKIKYSDLVNMKSREEAIESFLPILHLSNSRKIELEQNEPFGDIHINIRKDIQN